METEPSACQLSPAPLQAVAALGCGPLLSSGQALLAECVSGLLELAGTPSTSPGLTGSIVSLLAQLGSPHPCLLLCLQGEVCGLFFFFTPPLLLSILSL